MASDVQVMYSTLRQYIRIDNHQKNTCMQKKVCIHGNLNIIKEFGKRQYVRENKCVEEMCAWSKGNKVSSAQMKFSKV